MDWKLLKRMTFYLGIIALVIAVGTPAHGANKPSPRLRRVGEGKGEGLIWQGNTHQ